MFWCFVTVFHPLCDIETPLVPEADCRMPTPSCQMCSGNRRSCHMSVPTFNSKLWDLDPLKRPLQLYAWTVFRHTCNGVLEFLPSCPKQTAGRLYLAAIRRAIADGVAILGSPNLIKNCGVWSRWNDSVKSAFGRYLGAHERQNFWRSVVMHEGI